MIKNKRLGSGGYTLIELLIATVVTALVIIGVLTFLTRTLTNNSIRQTQADLLREAQLTLDVLTKDVRLSANIDDNNRWADPNSPNAEATNGLGWEAGPSTLILASAAEDINRNILFQDATHYITEKNNIIYFVRDGSLYKRTLAANVANNSDVTTCPPESAGSDCPADRQLVNNVESFSIKYFNNMDEEVEPSQARSVEVRLSLKKFKYNRDVTAQYATRTVFRNE